MQREDDKISKLLGGLENVEAPLDFERRVMKRIAERRGADSDQRPVILIVLKFAAPALILLVIGGFLVFFEQREIDTASVPPVREAPMTAAREPGPLPDETGAVEPSAPVTMDADQASTKDALRSDDGGGNSRRNVTSEDFAVKGPGETYTPRGFDPNKRSVNSTNAAPNKGTIELGEALSMIGLSTSCGADGCMIGSVADGSLAARAGVLAGDRIISIDGNTIKGVTQFKGRASFKLFQVVRGSSVINITLSVR